MWPALVMRLVLWRNVSANSLSVTTVTASYPEDAGKENRMAICLAMVVWHDVWVAKAPGRRWYRCSIVVLDLSSKIRGKPYRKVVNDLQLFELSVSSHHQRRALWLKDISKHNAIPLHCSIRNVNV